ncbi:MAG: tripartite tricarboxylate transporter permease [Tropicimonas sp.]|uniref:tripartite tricarboxylate transporter permease n=1 Tax=Tropicimonas sp. TaxID=2067044 RepID=UPI003A8BDAF2
MDFLANLSAGFSAVLAPAVLLAMVLGTVLGVLIGALPGLSATMGIAVLIPFTFGMEPLIALGIVAGIYNGAMYGGSIPAILLRIPGTPAGVATVFDGYPMTRQGRSRLALRVSLYSSAFGSFVSAVCLILLSPPLATLSLKFGPSQYFWLAIFGMFCITSVLGGSLAKGMIATCFGILLGLVGIDQITGAERYTFGHVELISGFSIIVVLTGLYAIPPALDLAEKALHVSSADLAGGEARDDGFRLRSLLPLWLRSSAIGVGVGIIPGAGGNIAAIISWNEARRQALPDEKFGEGEPKGVAAAECANNADTAATLIPALTLGVPGSAVAAVIMGVLLVHGMRPGPALFRDTAEITYGFMIAMGITALMMVPVGAFGSRLFINALRLPPLILASGIVVLTSIGVYTVGNSMAEVWIMLGFGLIGYAMEKLDIPTAPTVLAIILGPMAEAEMRRALLISGNDPGIFFSGVVNWIFIALIGAMLALPMLRRRKAAAGGAGPDDKEPQQ